MDFWAIPIFKHGRPTVKPAADFKPEEDAEALQKAMKGLGTDEETLIKILCCRANYQRIEIAKSFKTMYGRDLIDEIKSETSGHFKELLAALLIQPTHYYAHELHRAVKGLGTDETCLIELMCSLNNQQIRNARRDESREVDVEKAKKDAERLYEAGELILGTDEATFNEILASQSYPQLLQVFLEYENLTGNTIETAIDKEFSGSIREALLAIVKCVRSKIDFYAERFYKSMKGLGTDDKALIRLVVTHCEVDLMSIKESFLLHYEQSLEAFIEDDTSGDYRKALLTLVKARGKMACPGFSRYSAFPQGQPTVYLAPDFDPRKDAEVLRLAMKGLGTDEKTIITILCKRANVQRLDIALEYKTLYGKDLIQDLKSELSGNFRNLIVALMTPLSEFYAQELHNAMKGLGTDENCLIEIMCSLRNYEIKRVCKSYEKQFKRHLENDLVDDTSGHFRRLLRSLCTANRNENEIANKEAAFNDVKDLLRAGELQFGTNEPIFNAVLCSRGFEQLLLIFEEYERVTGHTIEKAIKREFSDFFAERLYKSMKGLGTDDKTLIRIVVTRCEVDMVDIKAAFFRRYQKTLESFI
ncbi:Annexin, partial [Gryllus bimaculatus]